MQKFFGIAIVAFGLYLAYGVYFEYNRFNVSNTVAERAESYAADTGNYAAASYFQGSRSSPYWGKIILFGLGSVLCLAIGTGMIAANMGPKAP